jgi:hypothetical protein
LSASDDFLHEMPDAPPPDDAIPAAFAQEVRFAVSGPPPVPSGVLATVLAGGLSAAVHPDAVHPTEKGDLLATAASNVHGPAPQVAGLPNWRRGQDMPVSGVLPGLLAKMASLGTTAKAALAGVTAVTTMGLAGGAAGMLPGPAQSLVATAVNATTPFQFPGADGATAAVEHATANLPKVGVPDVSVPPVPAVPPAPVGATARAGSTGSGTAAAGVNPAGTPGVPGVPALPDASGVNVPPRPSLTVPPAVAGLVKNLPACVGDLVPTGGTAPDPAKLATAIPACIPQVLAAAGLPTELARCISSVLGAIGGASGMSAGSVPNVGNLSVSSCVPVDATRCVSSVLSFLGTIPGLPGVPGGGSLPGMGSIPGVSGAAGCVPMNVTACITSITAAVSHLPASGTAPRLDLSACMPTGVAGGGAGGVSGLPGLGGALPFFGR